RWSRATSTGGDVGTLSGSPSRWSGTRLQGIVGTLAQEGVAGPGSSTGCSSLTLVSPRPPSHSNNDPATPHPPSGTFRCDGRLRRALPYRQRGSFRVDYPYRSCSGTTRPKLDMMFPG